MRLRLPRTLPLLAGAALLGAAALPAQGTGGSAASVLDSVTLAGFRWRNIGPANMGGRVADIVGIPSPSKTFYVAAAGGGIWKTTNAGTTFRPVFEHERVVSMGALAIAPSDTNQVWAGTGEQNTRNSISPGGGIYKSTDGGNTWKLMGLEATQQIGRIVVHPTNPNIVYVAALGHAWGPNKERGIYKTTDGGRTWQLIKFIDDRTGFIDIAIDPSNPDVLYASSYQRVRGPWFLRSGGPGSGLWKTTDAGKTWTEITGGGFPATTKGRIGIAISRSNPQVVYALVEADSMRGKHHPVLAPASDSLAAKPLPAKAQRLLSGLYRSEDGGKSWRWMNDRDVRPFYYSQVRVDPKDPNRVYWSSTPVNFSEDGGKSIRNATVGIHVDHHAMWIDPNDPEHFIVGDDGGVSQTWDRGGNYDFLSVITIAQPYEVSYDMAIPYHVCAGLQDNGSWCGPSRKKTGPITAADWITVGGGDGFYTAQDPTDPNIVYAESQGGNIGRLNIATGERTPLVKPTWRPRYTQWEDSILTVRGDTTKAATKEEQKRIAALRESQRKDSTDFDLRFNWNTPYFLSPHSPTTMYVGGNRVLKSTARGDDLYPISPDLSTRDLAKVRFSMDSTGGVTNDATGAETYGTITTLAESYVRPGLLYAGTDDGNVWLTRNDGATWENLTGRFPGVPAHTYVVRIEPSHADTNTFYVAFDGHRTNDFTPYLYVTHDFGKSFQSIVNDLPTGGPDFLHVIREDPVRSDLLYVGTDVGAYVSLDRGRHWQRFMTGLPTVPVHDLKIHPRDHELIAATHGRGIWIVGVAPLEQLTDSVRAQQVALFEPATAYEYGEAQGASGDPGQKLFAAPSPAYGADIAYRVAEGDAATASAGSHAGSAAADTSTGRRGARAPRARARIVITDVRGDTLRTLQGPVTPGVHHVTWDFRGKAPKPKALSPAERRDSVLTQRKIAAVFDSLANEGVAPRAALDRIREQITSGAGFGELFRRRRGGQESGRFVERPGEGPVQNAGSGASHARGDSASAKDTTHAAAQGAAAGGEEGFDPELLGTVFERLRSSGAIQGFGRRNAAPLAETGDYLVTLTVNGVTQKQVLRVERASGSGGEGSFFGEDDDHDP
ncbi:MAG TPA: hypothetical protein VFS44_06515 [Gemmatimonadaceae bacterium]|nr:hypothetical protein [Gemmatimonadaceae bacterium]